MCHPRESGDPAGAHDEAAGRQACAAQSGQRPHMPRSICESTEPMRLLPDLANITHAMGECRHIASTRAMVAGSIYQSRNLFMRVNPARSGDSAINSCAALESRSTILDLWRSLLGSRTKVVRMKWTPDMGPAVKV